MEERIENLGSRLVKAFEQVPDPRSPLGRRHSLPAILTLAVCAMLANCHSLYAIHQWGREHGDLAPRLGFKGSKTPAVSTLHLVFKLDFTQNPGKVMDDITFVRSHWWLVSEGFSLSTANSDVQKLPATLYHRIADSLAYAA